MHQSVNICRIGRFLKGHTCNDDSGCDQSQICATNCTRLNQPAQSWFGLCFSSQPDVQSVFDILMKNAL